MNLNLKLDPTNWLEVTWFEQTSTPDTIIPAKEAVLDEESNEVSPAEPERVEPGQVTKTQVKCVSYHPTQIDMLRADAAALGTDLAEHEALLADWVASYVPPVVPKVVPQTVSRFQARAALYQANLLNDIEAYMALETTDFFTKLAWKEAAEFNRTSPLVTEVGVLLGLTEVQLDDLFRFANTITA